MHTLEIFNDNLALPLKDFVNIIPTAARRDVPSRHVPYTLRVFEGGLLIAQRATSFLAPGFTGLRISCGRLIPMTPH